MHYTLSLFFCFVVSSHVLAMNLPDKEVKTVRVAVAVINTMQTKRIVPKTSTIYPDFPGAVGFYPWNNPVMTCTPNGNRVARSTTPDSNDTKPFADMP